MPNLAPAREIRRETCLLNPHTCPAHTRVPGRRPHAGCRVFKLLDFLRADFPVAILAFHGHERDHVEDLVRKRGPVPDGQFAPGVTLFENLAVQHFHGDLVPNERDRGVLAKFLASGGGKALQITVEVPGAGHFGDGAELGFDIYFVSVARGHLDSLLGTGAICGDKLGRDQSGEEQHADWDRE